MGKVIVGIGGSHNAGVTAYIEDEDKYIIIELERLTGIKNISWATFNPTYDPYLLADWIKKYLKKIYGIDKIDIIRSVSSDYGGDQIPFQFNHEMLEHNQVRYIDRKEIITNVDTGLSSGDGWCAFHHKSHAAGTFYQSPFEDAVVFSYDGGGDDGWFMGYKMNKKLPKDQQMKTILYSMLDVGNPYMYLGFFIDDIEYIKDYGEAVLTYAGKLMGYAAYGKVRKEWKEPLREYYMAWDRTDYLPVEKQAPKVMKKLGDATGLIFHYNEDKMSEYHDHPEPSTRLKGQDAKDLIATSQKVFEELVFKEIKPYIDEYKTNVCLTGGCALNILLNSIIRKYVRKKYNKDVYVAPNSSDCGIPTGLVLDYVRPSTPPDLTYAGEDIIDKEIFFSYTTNKDLIRWEHAALDNITTLIQTEKIIGLVQGNSEHGPRALGNRSIICSPGQGMKDKLNEVKKREFYRPFAPIVRLDDVSKYFNWKGESRSMSYSCTVKNKYKLELYSIIHADETARVQTITREQNRILYDLLTEMDKQNIVPVLINTSFNVQGKPILNSYKDAFHMLEQTALDYVIILNEYTKKDGALFIKKRGPQIGRPVMLLED